MEQRAGEHHVRLAHHHAAPGHPVHRKHARCKRLRDCLDVQEGSGGDRVARGGVEAAVVFFELPTGETRISLRSRSRFDVASFARSLTEHGGGHDRAAGALLEMPIGEAVPWVLARLDAEFEEFLKRKL